MMKKINLFFGKMYFAKHRSEIYEDWDAAMKAGDSFSDVLKLARNRAAKNKKASLQELNNELLQRVGNPKLQGKLTLILKGFAPIGDLMILEGFGRSGKPEAGLLECAETIRRQASLTSYVKSAMMKPIASLAVVFGVIYYFGSSVLPPFEKMMPAENLDIVAKNGFYFATTVAQNIKTEMAIIAAIVAFAIWAPGNWSGKFRETLDKTVPFSVYREFQSAILLGVIATMASSGLSLDESLKMLAENASKWMRSYLLKMSRRLSNPKIPSEAQAMNVSFFSDYVLWRLEDAIRLKGISTGLKNVAEGSFGRIEAQVKMSVDVISQIATLITGLGIAWMMMTTINYGFAIKQFMESGGMK
jgi:type II secretory pathway component PulF